MHHFSAHPSHTHRTTPNHPGHTFWQFRSAKAPSYHDTHTTTLHSQPCLSTGTHPTPPHPALYKPCLRLCLATPSTIPPCSGTPKHSGTTLHHVLCTHRRYLLTIILSKLHASSGFKFSTLCTHQEGELGIASCKEVPYRTGKNDDRHSRDQLQSQYDSDIIQRRLLRRLIHLYQQRHSTPEECRTPSPEEIPVFSSFFPKRSLVA